MIYLPATFEISSLLEGQYFHLFCFDSSYLKRHSMSDVPFVVPVVDSDLNLRPVEEELESTIRNKKKKKHQTEYNKKFFIIIKIFIVLVHVIIRKITLNI